MPLQEQDRHAPRPQAMYFSSETWHLMPYFSAASATAFIIGTGPHTYSASYLPLARSSGSTGDKIKALLDAKADQITTEILATKVVTGELDGYTKEWDINGEQVTLGVKKN